MQKEILSQRFECLRNCLPQNAMEAESNIFKADIDNLFSSGGESRVW